MFRWLFDHWEFKAPKDKSSKYQPHQGEKEKARRRARMQPKEQKPL